MIEIYKPETPKIKVSVVKEHYDRDKLNNPNMSITFEDYCKEIEITHIIINDIEEWGK